jgi:hypothetical protein
MVITCLQLKALGDHTHPQMIEFFGSPRMSLQSEFQCAEPVAWSTPHFAKWAGEAPGSTYGGKPIIDFEGEPVFAEIAIVRTLRKHGLQAVWVSQAFGRLVFRDAFSGKPPKPDVPSNVVAVLTAVAADRGGTFGGTWDVVAWPAEDPDPQLSDLRFIESKYHGNDSIDIEQVKWFQAMRARGAPLTSFLVLDWRLT